MKRLQRLIDTVGSTARDLWLRGWAERNAGNLSFRLSPEDLSGVVLREEPWRDLEVHAPEVAGARFLATATGSCLRVLEQDPDRDLGVIEIEEGGRRCRTLWGYRDGGGPTSELPTHLRAHASRLRAGDDEKRAVVHTHPPNLIALTYATPLTTESLTRILWEMHTECIVVFPSGCGFLDWRMPGSEDLARATEEVFEKRTLVVWQHHGAVALEADFETAFGLIETAERAAEIYLKVAALGPVSQRLSTAQLTALARRFEVEPDPEILG